MTPFRLRLSVAAFLALAAAISTNALYLQDAPHQLANTVKSQQPSPNGATATAALPDASPATVPATDTPAPKTAEAAIAVHEPAPARAEESPLPPPSPLVKNIQRELSQRGYHPGRQDGVLTRDCRMAILAYEFDEKMPLSGDASEAVLKALIFAKATGSTAKPGTSERFEHRKDLIEQVQQMLAQYGYTSGPVNGMLDTKTRDAIKKFESDRHLEAAGHLTERVLLEMVIVAGRPFPANG